ncbi:hypothetical protein G6L32_05670 [Agrobacterium tumefaciens]|uniref:hypothetical protein n=1 Tax=Agrobacterium tumefaciens TaxID=358 RepID=UPI0015720A27|nr:hypothetical protein [Agrobacterium tumefaciens]
MSEETKAGKTVRAAVFGLLCTGAGAIGGYYMTDRAAYKAGLEANYTVFTEQAGDVDLSLKVFADIARGKRVKTEEDLSQLQERLNKASTAADNLARRLNDHQIYKVFRQAGMDLKTASDKATDPLNSRDLLVAVDQYKVAEEELRQRVIKQQRSLFF